MGHFEELCALCAVIEERRQSVETITRREAARLLAFWKRWLGLPAENRVDDTGRREPYISTGYIDSDGRFHLASVEDIPAGRDGSLNVELRTLISASNKRPPACVSVGLQVVSVGDLGVDIAVTINDDAPVNVFVGTSDGCASDAIARRIKIHIQDELKAAYPACFL